MSSSNAGPMGPLGVLALAGRGPLAHELLHEQPLWHHALQSLTEVLDEVVVIVEPGGVPPQLSERPRMRTVSSADWPGVVRRGRPLLVHDPLCPLVPPDVLADVRRRGEEHPDTSYAAYRPVTDTVKTAAGGRIVGTIDREQLAALSSPFWVAGALAASLDADALCDPERLLRRVRAAGATELVVAPSIARRVDDVSAVHLLECVDELEHRLRHAAALSAARAPRTP